MKKKAGSFFKNVLSKGKNLFKKDERHDQEENKNEDYGTEEDHDFIEVGKSKGARLPSSQLLSNISEFAGSTISAADQLIHGAPTTVGNGHQLKSSKSEVTLITNALQSNQKYQALNKKKSNLKKTNKNNFEKSHENEDDEEEDDAEQIEIENWYFAELDKIGFCEFNPNFCNEEEKQQLTSSINNSGIKTIDFIMMVGFHHKVGSQVEYIYPPINEDVNGEISAEFLRQIPLMALPDGSHATEGGYVNFMLRDEKNLFHCISCYRQIPANLLPQEDSISRAFVQKAVVVLSKIPLYGEIRAKLQPTTEALFAQKNFKDTQILQDLYTHANTFNKGIVKDISELFTGINLKPAILLQNFHILTVIKVMMLEGRIIVYSQTSSKVSNFIYSLIALFPGAFTFKYHGSEQVLNYLKSLNDFGFPFQLYNSESLLIPLLSLQDVDLFDNCKGYLAGTTNQLFLSFPKSKADIIINLDNDKIDFPNEKIPHNMIKVCKNHTNYEKKMISSIVKCIDVTTEDITQNKAQQLEKKVSMIRKQDQNETQGFMNFNESEQSLIRQELKLYFQQLIVQMALAQRYIDQYNNLSKSPSRNREKQSNKSSSDDEKIDESENHDEQTIILEKTQNDSSQVHYQMKSLIKDDNNIDYSISEYTVQESIPKDQSEEGSVEDARKKEEKSRKEQKSRSKSKGSKIEKFSEKIQNLSENQEKQQMDKDKLKKINQLKKKALKSILEYNNMFNLKFLLAWTKTYNFSQWMIHHNKKICALSPQSGFVQSVQIFYDNGDFYLGNLQNGIRQGLGKYYEWMTGLTYNGEWYEDLRHGNGSLTSLNQDYVFEGEWYRGVKQGKGQLITKKEKYSGLWLQDKYHKNGVLVEMDGTVYEGDWVLGKKEGMGQLRNSKGDFYIGEFKNDTYNGKGQLKYGLNGQESGELYNGEFRNGMRHGLGQYVSADTLLQFEGEWADNLKHGKGSLYIVSKENQSQKQIEGEWLKDEFQFERQANVTFRDKSGKVISNFEGRIDQDYNPIFT